MSDYTIITDFAAKDSLQIGDGAKRILGSQLDTEFQAIAVAIASKYDPTDITSQATAEAGVDNTSLNTPLRTAQQLAAHDFSAAGIETIVKAATESVNSSTTMQSDDELAGFTVDSGSRYGITGMLRLGIKLSSGMKLGFSFTNSPDEISVEFTHISNLASAGTGDFLLGDSDTAAITTGNTSDTLIFVRGFINQGSPGGTFDLEWAQTTSVAEDTKIKDGSWLSIHKV